MSRQLTWVLGPESLTIATISFVFWFCGRHSSGEGRDVELLEKVVMSIPFVVVPLMFLTLFVPGAKNWLWLGRVVILTYAGLSICAWRLISGFGTGARGQDAAFMMVFAFATILIAFGGSIACATILAEVKPAFAEWFRGHKFLGSFLTLLSAVPIGFGLGVSISLLVGIFAGFYSVFSR